MVVVAIHPRVVRALRRLTARLRVSAEPTERADGRDADVVADELARGRLSEAAQQLAEMDTAARDLVLEQLPVALRRRLGYETAR